MTDGELAKAAARLRRLHNEAHSVIEQIAGHPNGEQIIRDLHDNGLGYLCDFGSIVHEYMIHPERWELTQSGILHWTPKRRSS